jgi:protoporphyrinogen oxidase
VNDAVVIGAGPAGLTAAYELDKLGRRSVVLEADELVGGLARTVTYKGYRFDIGGHRFFSKVALVNDIWQEILGPELLTRPRLSRIHYRGRYFNYPLKAMDALAGLGPLESARIGLSYAKARLMPHRDESNLESWVSNRFGWRLYQIFFKTYTEKVWGIPCNEISADWAAQRIKNLSMTEAVRNALFGAARSKEGQVITTLIERFLYPRLGPGMMWERCVELLRANGSETVTGMRVEKVQHRDGRVECVVGRNAAGETTEFRGEHFISTMPLRELLHALDPVPPDEVMAAADRLRYRDYLTVVLMVKREKVFEDNWIYIHTPEVKVGRVQNYKNWSPEMVPDPTRTSLGLEYFLWEKDEEWRWPDERLVELGIREMAQLGIVPAGEVEDGTVVRMKKAYPIYDGEYQEVLRTLRGYLATFRNLQTVGRNGLHRYTTQDHSMVTGVYAARNVEGADLDVWSVNVEKEYHEEGVVEEGRRREPAAAGASGERMVPSRVAARRELDADRLLGFVFARLDAVALGAAVGIVCGVALFLATIVLLLKRGPVVGPTLALLGQYLPGYAVNWRGSIVGLVEGGMVGFLAGALVAWLRNFALRQYARIIKRRADARERRDLLDKV